MNPFSSSPTPTIAWTDSLHGVATSTFGSPTEKGAFYEVTEMGNVLGSPPIALCFFPSSPPPDGSQNETVGLNYSQNASSGETCGD
jgi:hypothetical protein